MRRMLMSRCSFEKPSSDERCLRTTSPSSSVTGRPPISISLTISALAMVDLPEPDRPVKNTVKPCSVARRRGAAQLGDHLGEGEPFGDVEPLAQAAAQLGARDVEHGRALGDLVGGVVLRLFLDVDHVFEVDHLDADLVLVLS